MVWLLELASIHLHIIKLLIYKGVEMKSRSKWYNNLHNLFSLSIYHTSYKTIFFVKFIEIYYFSITVFISFINLQITVNILTNSFV